MAILDGIIPMKLKRKDIDDVNYDFSISSPARKIRRLDTDLPPIMEEDEPETPIFVNNKNEERAIVVFKPVNGNFYVDPDIISACNRITTNRFFSSSELPNGDEQSERNENKCLAVVPWVPLQLPKGDTDISHADIMEADEYGAMAMDVEEDDNNGANERLVNLYDSSGSMGNEGLPWQQHCFVSQPPHSVSTPVSWFR